MGFDMWESVWLGSDVTRVTEDKKTAEGEPGAGEGRGPVAFAFSSGHIF